MNDTISLLVPARSCYLRLIRGLIDNCLKNVISDEKLKNRIVLAVNEAYANVIEHAYSGEEGRPFELKVIIEDKKITIILKDEGKKVPLKEIKPRDLDDIKPGGLGTHFIKEIMDEVIYDISPPVGTFLRMVKNLP